MLIAGNGDYAGLLSGGCLEGDLRDHAMSVIKTGQPEMVAYDNRGPDDLIWGLGLGCEGAMEILLFRIGPESDWQPFTHLVRSLATSTRTAVGIVMQSSEPVPPVGTFMLPAHGALAAGGDTTLLSSDIADEGVQAALHAAALSGRAETLDRGRFKIFVLPLALPPRLLMLGAGPDASPVVEFAARLNWKVTVVDHRAAYAQAEHFPGAEKVILSRPNELSHAVDLTNFSAAVIMSHHLPSDLEYLRSLAPSPIPYVGLLGPVARREKLLSDAGPAAAESLRPRLHAPVGLALGGRAPESIALAIVAEIHAFVHVGDQGARRAGAAA